MKKVLYNISAALFAAAMIFTAASCSKQETPNLPEEPKAETITLSASMEIPDSDTKTTLGQNNTVLWSEEDPISVFFGTNTTNCEFTLVGTGGSASGSFTGTASETSNTIYAVYPHNPHYNTINGSTISLVLPVGQYYNPNGFDDYMNTAVAYTTTGGNLEFKNLCGVLKVSLSGSATIEAIQLTGVDNLSGPATVSMNYGSGEPTLTMTGTDKEFKTVDLYFTDPVILTATPQDFYFVVPPTDKGFRVTVYEANSTINTMTKVSTTPINRNKIRPMPALTYAADTPIDLSGTSNGTANCYIPSTGAGRYKFKATIMGNGADGIITGGNFPTTDAVIAPLSASLYWEDVPGLITDVELIEEGSEKYVTFVASKSLLEGNAIISVSGNSHPQYGPILWSWHIWCTDQPADQAYKNTAGKDFTLLDRNLGATSATPADGTSTYGLLYQWGRKDPFPSNDNRLYPGLVGSITKIATSAENGTIANTIKTPATFYTSSTGDWYWKEGDVIQAVNNHLWGNPRGYVTDYTASKSIYDPCPPGYMVAPRDTWTNFDKGSKQPNKEGDWSNGFNFFLQGSTLGTPTTWYPAVGCRNFGDGLLADSDIAYYWSSSPFSSGDWTANLYFHSSRVNTWAYENRAYGFSVRCLLVGGK